MRAEFIFVKTCALTDETSLKGFGWRVTVSSVTSGTDAALPTQPSHQARMTAAGAAQRLTLPSHTVASPQRQRSVRTALQPARSRLTFDAPTPRIVLPKKRPLYSTFRSEEHQYDEFEQHFPKPNFAPTARFTVVKTPLPWLIPRGRSLRDQVVTQEAALSPSEREATFKLLRQSLPSSMHQLTERGLPEFVHYVFQQRMLKLYQHFASSMRKQRHSFVGRAVQRVQRHESLRLNANLVAALRVLGRR